MTEHRPALRGLVDLIDTLALCVEAIEHAAQDLKSATDAIADELAKALDENTTHEDLAAIQDRVLNDLIPRIDEPAERLGAAWARLKALHETG